MDYFFVSPFAASSSHKLFCAVAYEMSRLLNTGVDREQLSILISLCENGVNPEVRPSALDLFCTYLGSIWNQDDPTHSYSFATRVLPPGDPFKPLLSG